MVRIQLNIHFFIIDDFETLTIDIYKLSKYSSPTNIIFSNCDAFHVDEAEQ